MLKRKFLKLSSSLIKLILPILFKLLLKTRNNRRVINYLNEKSYFSNKFYDFSIIINNFLKSRKIVALDVGAQGALTQIIFFQKNIIYFLRKF